MNAADELAYPNGINNYYCCCYYLFTSVIIFRGGGFIHVNTNLLFIGLCWLVMTLLYLFVIIRFISLASLGACNQRGFSDSVAAASRVNCQS